MEEKILQELKKINGRFDNLEGRFDNLETKVDSIDVQVKENTSILRALEHAAGVNKAEHDNMNFAIAEIIGDVKAIRKDLSAVEVVTANNWSEIARIKAVK